MIRFRGIEIDRLNRTVSHRGVSRTFCSTQNSITFKMFLFFLLAGGASKKMMFWHLYGDDPEGGPLGGEGNINVMLHQLNEHHLQYLQLETRSWRIAGVSFYEIVPVFEVIVPGRFSYSRGTVAVKISGTPINSLARLA